MSDIKLPEPPENDRIGSYSALLVAFKTMKKRCQELQTRLTTVEEENVCLRLECGKAMSSAKVWVNNNSEKTVEQALQVKVEELTKQKSQLTHHVFMVTAENRQLWNSLTKLTRTNKSLGKQLTKISHTLKQHSAEEPGDIGSCSFPEAVASGKLQAVCNSFLSCNLQDSNKTDILPDNNDKKHLSLEEISLRLINNIRMEKSDLEEQYAQMVELQNSSELNLRIDITDADDSDTDSLEQLKQHDIRLSQTKDALLEQQARLKRVLQNLKNIKDGVTCNNCRTKANKTMCQTGTQFDSDDSFKEHGATQTSLSPIMTEKNSSPSDSVDQSKICPICGDFFGKPILFPEFHEHVLSHFNNKQSIDEIEVLNNICGSNVIND